MEKEDEIRAGMAALPDKTVPGTKAEIALAREMFGETFDIIEGAIANGDWTAARAALVVVRLMVDALLAGAQATAAEKRIA